MNHGQGKVLIIGASGTVGTELVKILKQRSVSVARATSKTNLEADQVHVDLLRKSDLEPAFKNVDRVFLLAPPGHTNQDEILMPVIEMAKARGVKKVVLMSAMGANADDNAPMRKAELLVERSGLPFNIIRPNWFMQNFNTFWIQGILQQGKVLLPVGRAKASFIDARDIAAVAAELLVTDMHVNQAFDLTGAEAIDHSQAASALSEATGKDIRFQDITPDEMRAGLLGAGLPPAYTEFLLVILNYLKLGYAERVTDSVERITGRAPIQFHSYAADYKRSWL